MRVHVELNGVPQYLDVAPGEPLLSLLRRVGLKSVKEGCDAGDCGACTVLVDGRAVRSCLMVAPQVQGRKVTTLEGLGMVDDLHPLQEAFLETGAVQCGFCTPGMILVARELVSRNGDPTADEVRAAISGNLCRCTGYVKIVDAILLAARWKREGKWR